MEHRYPPSPEAKKQHSQRVVLFACCTLLESTGSRSHPPTSVCTTSSPKRTVCLSMCVYISIFYICMCIYLNVYPSFASCSEGLELPALCPRRLRLPSGWEAAPIGGNLGARPGCWVIFRAVRNRERLEKLPGKSC